jgi:hypothetical protein
MLDKPNVDAALDLIEHFGPSIEKPQPCVVHMDKGAEKVSIFDTLKAPHDKRFVAFKDISEKGNSKFSR